MASLQREPTGVFHIVARIGGKRFKRSLESKAIAKRDEIDETIKLLKRGKIVVPDGLSAIDFVLGKTEIEIPAPTPSTNEPVTGAPNVTLRSLFNSVSAHLNFHFCELV